MLPYFPLTGVIRPLPQPLVSKEAVPMAGGIILGITGLIILIVVLNKKLRQKEEPKEIGENVLGQYVQDALQKGYSKEYIRELLIKSGWPEDVVDCVCSQILVNRVSSG